LEFWNFGPQQEELDGKNGREILYQIDQRLVLSVFIDMDDLEPAKNLYAN
jgi:hypothetical protein